MTEKQTLLRQYRRKKRIGVFFALLMLLFSAAFLPWFFLPFFLFLLWIIHEAWFSDHLFYTPRQDYRYRFPEHALKLPAALEASGLRLENLPSFPDESQAETLILEVRIHAKPTGYALDPQVVIDGDFADCQEFERGLSGIRYLNLTGHSQALREGRLRIHGARCRLEKNAMLHLFTHPDYSRKRILIIAPHADDAELAAFGLYCRAGEAGNTRILTLTQGEIEAGHYRRFTPDKAAAARLKGRLRTWDSLAAPLWGNVPQNCCVQLGYYCLQLMPMYKNPAEDFSSRESGETDIRAVRRHNPFPLPSDADGRPNWDNLVADIQKGLEHFCPEAILTPHPLLDPHPDHIAATKALWQALEKTTQKPEALLYYANHLHHSDRWPMGPAKSGIPLPPCFEPDPQKLPQTGIPFSLTLSETEQNEKAVALSLQHDLQTPLRLRQSLRRIIQCLLTRRTWPLTGKDEFFRKNVRRHELFWVSKDKCHK